MGTPRAQLGRPQQIFGTILHIIVSRQWVLAQKNSLWIGVVALKYFDRI